MRCSHYAARQRQRLTGLFVTALALTALCFASLPYPAMAEPDPLPDPSPVEEISPVEAPVEAPADLPAADDQPATDQPTDDQPVDGGSPADVDDPTDQTIDDSAAADDSSAPSGAPLVPLDITSTVTSAFVARLAPTGAPTTYATVTNATTRGSLVSLAGLTALPTQRFRIEPIANSDYCLIRNVGSQFVLDVKGAKANSGAAVQQWGANGSPAQSWLVHENDDGSYLILSALTTAEGGRLMLAVDPTTQSLQLATYPSATETPDEADSPDATPVPDEASTPDTTEAPTTWILSDPRTAADGTYRLAPSHATNRALDVAGGSLAKGANIRSYNSNGSNAQRYALTYNPQTGYYTISVVSSGLVLDVEGGSTKAGANIRQWSSNGSEAQQWDLQPTTTAGRYLIVSRKSGLALDVAGGSTASGANVRLWRSNASKAQQWQATPVSPLANGVYTVPTFAAQGFGLDVKGGKRDPFTNLQLYKLNGSAAQQFEIIEYASGRYTIRSVSNGLYISVRGASTTARTNVDLEGGIALDDGRLWRAYPGPGGIVFVSASGLALDVAGGKLASGSNVWAYTRNNNASQRFVLKGVAGAKLLGITQVEAELPTATETVARTTTTRIGGKSYLLLPSHTNAAKLQLQALTTREGRLAEYATSENGSYTAISPTTTINLTKGFAKESNGAYVIWLRTKGTNEARPIRVLVSANLRALYLTSDDPANQGRAYIEASSKVHDNKTTGSMLLVEKDGQIAYDGALSQIKGRGNSTWRQDKKPYQIKLAKKASLLDGTAANKAKTWLLLANYLDTTMERDYLSKKLALSIGLSNTPDCEYVDLYYDGAYRGTYQLSEKVQVGSGRVEISDLEADNEALNGDTSAHAVRTAKNSFGRTFHYVDGITDPADITGGYIVEFDFGTYDEERCWFQTSIGPFVLKAPEDASYAQVKYISEYVQRMINEGRKPDGKLGNYLDVASLAKVALVNEVAKNPDWLKYSSTFFYKDRGKKLVAGPVWDFDLAYGVARQDVETMYSLMAVEGLMSDQYGFFGTNKQFKSALVTAYKAGAKQTKALVTGGSSGKGTIGDTGATLARSWTMNRLLWPHKATVYVPMTLSSRDDALAHLWQWTAARVNWLDNRMTGSKTPVVGMGSAVSGTFVVVGGTGRALAIAGGSTANGANVHTWKRDGSTAQQFEIKAVGKSASGEWYYRITNVKSKKVLEAAGGKTAPGTNVVQHSYNGTAAQHWILRRTSTDSGMRFQIVNLKSRLALDIGNGENKDGANVGLYLVCGNNNAQNWFLRK